MLFKKIRLPQPFKKVPSNHLFLYAQILNILLCFLLPSNHVYGLTLWLTSKNIICIIISEYFRVGKALPLSEWSKCLIKGEKLGK